jgi:hypothetical protein
MGLCPGAIWDSSLRPTLIVGMALHSGAQQCRSRCLVVTKTFAVRHVWPGYGTPPSIKGIITLCQSGCSSRW